MDSRQAEEEVGTPCFGQGLICKKRLVVVLLFIKSSSTETDWIFFFFSFLQKETLG